LRGYNSFFLPPEKRHVVYRACRKKRERKQEPQGATDGPSIGKKEETGEIKRLTAEGQGLSQTGGQRFSRVEQAILCRGVMGGGKRAKKKRGKNCPKRTSWFGKGGPMNSPEKMKNQKVPPGISTTKKGGQRTEPILTGQGKITREGGATGTPPEGIKNGSRPSQGNPELYGSKNHH